MYYRYVNSCELVGNQLHMYIGDNISQSDISLSCSSCIETP